MLWFIVKRNFAHGSLTWIFFKSFQFC